MSDNDPLGRATPPDGEDDHRRIWSAVDKAEKAWVIVGSLHAIVSNWKPLVVLMILIGILSGPEVLAFLASTWGINQ